MKHYITLEAGKESKKHYENFPVATFLYPRKIRDAATILYQFARTVDDIADEGSLSDEKRLKKIEIYQHNLNLLKKNNENVSPLFIDIYKVMNQYSISTSLLQKFLDAFKQDVTKKRYKDFDEIINYTNKAAAPAGEMILALFNKNTKENIKYSNSICHALALIGMSQDIHEDILKDRLYIPMSQMKKYNLEIADIHNKKFNKNWKKFKKSWIKLIKKSLLNGLPLLKNTKGRLNLQIKIMIGAAKILTTRMNNDNCNLFTKPPKLSKIDWLLLFFKCIISK
jgi:squalene synthase HpnC|tara:strand:- start:2446 stop:3291 length:846 start_codon:yes stop_codon:yes gene_type:complete